ncbi:MBL fold metallo-hydrolase [Fictibacillus phosphorivorans]|uniref:MBL fold metallo-hydrolase n=1 Tax=Fictibacillus phosphorivorans TaxID=1221500 RepID=UPI00203C4DF5|nr:MBL fold metallo-hydrolase [Fictibacillus phosphorivorans]MCM3716799.1 MBL fold metallo-hydrolase [Fictibacillus phosphorivorans]MCM3774652.1 MBL fold metallo-hydrolase [Fictibacillus phosphorivorans]
MKWKKLTVGPVQENTYILFDTKNEAIIIDPGSEGSKIIKYVESLKLKPLAVLLTHAHFDHIGAVDQMREKYQLPLYIHKKEKDWLTDPSKNGSKYFGQNIVAKPASHMITDADSTLRIGSFSFEILHTPGHSPGSVSFYLKNAGTVFSGDALFAGSIGRTDLNGGNQEILLKSIHEQLLQLPEETVVLSGHGPETTIGMEMDSNPFLGGF